MVERQSKKSKKNKPKAPEQDTPDSTSFESIRFKNGSLYLTLNVKPNSKQDSVTGVDQEAIGLSISEPPKDGQANEAVCAFIARVLNRKKYDVSLVRGHKSHSKVVEVEDWDSNDRDQVIKMLNQYL